MKLKKDVCVEMVGGRLHFNGLPWTIGNGQDIVESCFEGLRYENVQAGQIFTWGSRTANYLKLSKGAIPLPTYEYVDDNDMYARTLGSEITIIEDGK